MVKTTFVECINIVGENCSSFDGEKVYVSTGALDVNIIDFNKVEYIDYDNKPSRANLVVKPGDILFAKMSSTQKTLIIDTSNSNYVYSTGFYAISPKKNVINTRCLFHLVNSDIFLLKKDKYCSGATQKAINNQGLGKIIINLPSIEEQLKLCDELDHIKSMIGKKRMQLLFFDELIKSRFVEMFNSCKNLMPMGQLCSIITDGTHQSPKFQDSGIPFIFVSNLAENKVTYNAEKFISEETYQELYKRTPIEKGDLLLTTVGSYGHPAVVEEDRKFLFQRHIAYLKPKHELINSYYLHGALLAPDGQRQIEEKVKGIAQKTLNLSEIRRIIIPVPKVDKQNEFATFVTKIDKSKFVVQQSIDELQVLYDSLMQKYFG